MSRNMTPESRSRTLLLIRLFDFQLLLDPPVILLPSTMPGKFYVRIRLKIKPVFSKNIVREVEKPSPYFVKKKHKIKK